MLLHNFSSLIWSIQHAAELVKTVASRYDEYVSVKDLTDKINRSLTAAKKDNDFIYHDRVPEVKDLEQIGKAALVKPAAITPPLSQKFSGTNRGHTSILTWWNNLMKVNKKIKVKMIKKSKRNCAENDAQLIWKLIYFFCLKPFACLDLFTSDLFEKMVPMAVQQSMSIYSQRKAETVNRLVGTMREATNLCNGYAVLCL